MALYKVPQDVEADDKLLGPFSFRQFIYLMIVAMAIGIAWGLSRLFVPLAIIPLPIVIFFGALALPLRKDQPMETYLAAMVAYFLKPHRRLWDPDGIESLIEITVPKTIEYSRVKDLSTSEAERRFSYLSEIADSGGWSVRGVGVQAPNSPMRDEVYFEALQVQDVFDDSNSRVKSLDDKLILSNARRFQDAIDNMSNPVLAASLAESDSVVPNTPNYFNNSNFGEPTEIIVPPPTPTLAPSTASTSPAPTPTPSIEDQLLQYNPYPNIQQAVIQPIGQKDPTVQTPEPTTSEKVLPTGIINLASNTDFSIATIALEANRIQKALDFKQGMIIKLR